MNKNYLIKNKKDRYNGLSDIKIYRSKLEVKAFVRKVAFIIFNTYFSYNLEEGD